MSFYKYAHLFASGEKDEGWLEANSANLEELAREWQDRYNWSDHYRGVTFELVERPPAHWLRERISSAQASIRVASDRIDRYSALLEKADEEI